MSSSGELRSSTAHAAYLKALSHPLRLKILQAMNRGLASPKDIAEELGESLGVVSYHVRTLEELGCIELSETKFRRGAVQHFYRPLRRGELSTEEWSMLPPAVRHSLSTITLEGIIELAGESLGDDTFDARPDRHLSFVQLELDEEGWTEINGLLDVILNRAIELQERAVGDPEKVASVLALTHFERG